MKMGVLFVTAIKKPEYRTRVDIHSQWLSDTGFVIGTSAYAIPQQDGFTITTQGENNKHGKKISVITNKNRNYGSKPVIHLYLAKNFSSTGLSEGDFLAAKFEYGIIEAKKLPAAQKYCVIGSHDYEAFLQFSGGWLSDTGFMPDTATTVSVSDDGITFRVWDGVTESYADFVKFARSSKCQIIQPRKNQTITTMDIPGYILNRAGFGDGDICGIDYEYGAIRLFKPDLRKIGF